MATFGRRSKAQQWAKLGLLLTDAKLWSMINSQLRESAENVGEVMKDKYELVRRRVRGDSGWVASTASFLGGVGVGVALGMLFTPVSGEDARARIRGAAVDIKNKASDIASEAIRFRPSTGTEGE